MNDGDGALAAQAQGRKFGPLGTALVIIPTYNEAENIKSIVGRVRQSVPEAHVLVADDNSPDGTGKLADELAAEDEKVQVLHRKGKEGLGAAYLAGFRWGIDNGYGVLIEMDADGSHQPEELPRLLTALKGADLVLGSRWVPGGRVVNWPKSREFISRGGSLYSRVALDLPLRDITGGYRAFRRETLEGLGLDDVASQGYCFQVDLARRAVKAWLPRRRGPHHLRGARTRRLQDEPRHPRRGPVAGHHVGRGRARRQTPRPRPPRRKALTAVARRLHRPR